MFEAKLTALSALRSSCALLNELKTRLGGALGLILLLLLPIDEVPSIYGALCLPHLP